MPSVSRDALLSRSVSQPPARPPGPAGPPAGRPETLGAAGACGGLSEGDSERRGANALAGDGIGGDIGGGDGLVMSGRGAERAPRPPPMLTTTASSGLARRAVSGCCASIPRPCRATIRLSSASASIWSTITRRICEALSAVSCGNSRMPRRSSAHRVVLLGNGARALGGRVGDHPGDVARARLGGRERLLQQAGEAPQPCIELLGTGIETRDDGFEGRAPSVSSPRRLLVSIASTAWARPRA